jgi:hypothetical protein
MNSTAKEIDTEYKTAYTKLLVNYGSHDSIPKDELSYIGETHRAKMVLLTVGGAPDARVLSQYSIPNKVIEAICGETYEIQRKIRHADRRRSMETFVRENADAIVTPNELAEAGDVSYSTAMKFINENPLVFTKTERGAYLIRDVEAERKAAMQESSPQKKTVRRKR